MVTVTEGVTVGSCKLNYKRTSKVFHSIKNVDIKPVWKMEGTLKAFYSLTNNSSKLREQLPHLMLLAPVGKFENCVWGLKVKVKLRFSAPSAGIAEIEQT